MKDPPADHPAAPAGRWGNRWKKMRAKPLGRPDPGPIAGVLVTVLAAWCMVFCSPPAAAVEISSEATVDTLLFVLRNPDIVAEKSRHQAIVLLRGKIDGDPAIINRLDERIVAGYPEIFSPSLLRRLFGDLGSDLRARAATDALTAIAIHSKHPAVLEHLVSGLASALDTEKTAWWAADMASRLAMKKPGVLGRPIIDGLFRTMERRDSWLAASAALSEMALNPANPAEAVYITEHAADLLSRPASATQAAYIIFRISETQPHRITAPIVESLFAAVTEPGNAPYRRIEFPILTYTRERNAALYASDALASATGAKDSALGRLVFDRAFSRLQDLHTPRLASYILAKTARIQPRLFTDSHVAALFSLADGNEPLSHASEVLAELLSATRDERTASAVISGTLAALAEPESARWAAGIVAAGGMRWSHRFDGKSADRLLPLIDNPDTGPAVVAALSRIALHSDREPVARRIISALLARLRDRTPDMAAARMIVEVSRNRPARLHSHVESLFGLLAVDAVKNEMASALHFLHLSGAPDLRRRIARFIENQLDAESMEPPRHDALLFYAQRVSMELDRLHQIDPANIRMKELIQTLPDPLLYLILAQGVEGYVTTFKEIHRVFGHRTASRTRPPPSPHPADALWQGFTAVDPHAHFTGDLLYAYSAKGHFSHIVPASTPLQHQMVDAALNLVAGAHGVADVMQKGSLLAEPVSRLLRHPRTGAYAAERLRGHCRGQAVRSPVRTMLEALIFQNRSVMAPLLDPTEREAILHSGRYMDFTFIPGALSPKSQRVFLYFSDSQHGYLTRLIDYYTGRETLFVGNGVRPHPHPGRIGGFSIDSERSSPRVTDGIAVDRAIAERGDVTVVLVKRLENRNTVTFTVSNSLDELDRALEDAEYTAFGFAGHSGESWIFLDRIAERSGFPDRPLWVYDGSCGSARRMTHVVRSPLVFLFGNRETGKGPVNQIQIYYIAHYLAEGRFRKWHELRSRMIEAHTGYTSKLFYPGNPADSVLKNFLRNVSGD